MYSVRSVLALLVAAGTEPVAVLSPAWLPAHALRWLRDGLAERRSDQPLTGWSRSLAFRTDVRAGLTVPGLTDAVLALICDKWLVPDDGRWVMPEPHRTQQRRALFALDPDAVAAVAAAAERWQRYAVVPAPHGRAADAPSGRAGRLPAATSAG